MILNKKWLEEGPIAAGRSSVLRVSSDRKRSGKGCFVFEKKSKADDARNRKLSVISEQLSVTVH